MATFRTWRGHCPSGMLFDIAHQLVWHERRLRNSSVCHGSAAGIRFVELTTDSQRRLTSASSPSANEEIWLSRRGRGGKLSPYAAFGRRSFRRSSSRGPTERQEVLLKITESKSVSDAFNARWRVLPIRSGLERFARGVIRKHPDVR